jgi:hypothetical protein
MFWTLQNFLSHLAFYTEHFDSHYDTKNLTAIDLNLKPAKSLQEWLCQILLILEAPNIVDEESHFTTAYNRVPPNHNSVTRHCILLKNSLSKPKVQRRSPCFGQRKASYLILLTLRAF